MPSGPGFSKPAHQYGQSFGDQAEVLDGGSPFAPAVPQPLISEQPGGQIAPEALARSLDCEFGCLPMDHGEPDWAGRTFSLPYRELE